MKTHIPAIAPDKAYKDKGWKGMGDFLGTVSSRGGQWKREKGTEIQ